MTRWSLNIVVRAPRAFKERKVMAEPDPDSGNQNQFPPMTDSLTDPALLKARAGEKAKELRVQDLDGMSPEAIHSLIHDLTARQAELEVQLEELHLASSETTRTKQAESELLSAKEHLDAMISAMPDLMFELDREGRIHEFHTSAEDLLYVSPSLFLGKKVAEVLPENASRTIMAALEEAAERGIHRGGTYSLPNAAW